MIMMRIKNTKKYKTQVSLCLIWSKGDHKKELLQSTEQLAIPMQPDLSGNIHQKHVNQGFRDVQHI